MPCHRIRPPPGLRPIDDVDEMLLDAGIVPTSMRGILTDENGDFREQFHCDGCSDSGHSDNEGAAPVRRAPAQRGLLGGRRGRDRVGDNYGLWYMDFGVDRGRRRFGAYDDLSDSDRDDLGGRREFDNLDPLDSDEDLGGLGGLEALGETERRMNRLRGDLRDWARGDYARRGAGLDAGPAGGGIGAAAAGNGGDGPRGRRGRRNRPRAGAGRVRRGHRRSPADDSDSGSNRERAERWGGEALCEHNGDRGAGRTLGGGAGRRWRRHGGYDGDSDDSDWSESYTNISIWW